MKTILYSTAMPNVSSPDVPARLRAVNAGVPMAPVTSNYVPSGATNYHHVGALSDTQMSMIGTAIIGGAVYHGYKRTKSVGWAIGWGLFALVLPIVAAPVAIAQGFGKPKHGG